MLHPIAYASCSLDSSERNYGITELETLAVVWAAWYFRPYLLGHRTIVYSSEDYVASNEDDCVNSECLVYVIVKYCLLMSMTLILLKLLPFRYKRLMMS